MDVREKLVELLEKASYECDEGTRDLWDMREVADGIADYLIAHGVTLANQLASSSKHLASSEWISVKDRLPDMYQNVLAIRADGKIVVDAIGSLEIWYKQMDIVGRPVTHWMPLPQPPKGE